VLEVFEYGFNKHNIYYKKLLVEKIKVFKPTFTKLEKIDGIQKIGIYRALKRYNRRISLQVDRTNKQWALQKVEKKNL
jgi:hypothetical protein